MARRKSDSVKWTLVLVLVVFSHIVISRPQPELTSTSFSVLNVSTNKPTETSIRYGNNKNDIIHRFKSSLYNYSTNEALFNMLRVVNYNSIISSSISNRSGRIIRRKTIAGLNNHTQKKPSELRSGSLNSYIKPTNRIPISNKDTNKSNIRKVITKWTDNAKYEDLDISHDSNISNERDAINMANLVKVNMNHGLSAGNVNDLDENTKNQQPIQSNHKQFSYSFNKPKPQYSDETQLYSDNFHVIHTPTRRPTYIFSTPSPTPIITNVGYPKPWPEYNFQPQKRPTRKPIKSTTAKYPYNYHNSINNFSPYPDNNFEVTTFPPAGVYTDRIVIRPEEYSASPDDCPTIFVTLNNTFQGQAKEVCPDLNIAVNTNVVNKNVVIDSEEDTDTTLTDVFGLPMDDESGSDEVPSDYGESQENDDETESESLEGTGLSNYNAGNSVNDVGFPEQDNFGSPSSALSTFTKPNRPNDADDDVFSFTSLIEFFRPAVGAFHWLAAINPLSFGAISFFLTPIIILFAGASGLLSLFAPWTLSGRESQKALLYRPEWQWDNNYQSWYVNSLPHYNKWTNNPREITANYKTLSIRSTWLDRVKDYFKQVTKHPNYTDKSKSS